MSSRPRDNQDGKQVRVGDTTIRWRDSHAKHDLPREQVAYMSMRIVVWSKQGKKNAPGGKANDDKKEKEWLAMKKEKRKRAESFLVA